MITPFGLRHIWQVRDLAASCTVFDPAAWGSNPSTDPLHRALRGYVVRNSGTFTYVLRSVDGGVPWRGFVQAEKEQTASAWRVICLAPRIHSCSHAPTVWYHLLLHLCIAAGERHVQRLLACTEQDSPEEQVFRQASFAPYCHDSVWVLSGEPPPECQVSSRVRVARSEDAWGIQRLCTRVKPRPVRQVEGFGEIGSERERPDPPATDAGLVLTDSHQEIRGWATASGVGAVCWLHLVVDPDEREGVAELVRGALSVIPAAKSQVLCAVPDYQGGLAAVLAETGFERAVERSLLVKHTTVQVSESRRKLVPALEKRAGVVPTVPHCPAATLDRVSRSVLWFRQLERNAHWLNW